MIETENSSSESSEEIQPINDKKYDSYCNLISSHRNTEIRELKKGVYKFFRGRTQS